MFNKKQLKCLRSILKHKNSIDTDTFNKIHNVLLNTYNREFSIECSLFYYNFSKR
jgi:hypothetical protein